MTKRFYVCRHCGNLIGMIKDTGVPVFCCGQKMEALVPNTTEASNEKHIPVVSVEDGKVKVTVGSVAHPMEAEHYIEWVYLQMSNGGQRRAFKPGEKPEATFLLSEGSKPVAVFAYCNLHGLWVKEL